MENKIQLPVSYNQVMNELQDKKDLHVYGVTLLILFVFDILLEFKNYSLATSCHETSFEKLERKANTACFTLVELNELAMSFCYKN